MAELIALGQEVHSAMAGDAGFAGLQSQIDCLADETNKMILRNDGYQTALQLAQERFAQRQAQRATLENLLTELAGGVEDISIGNATLMENAGFNLTTDTTSPILPSPVEQLAAGIEGVAATR